MPAEDAIVVAEPVSIVVTPLAELRAPSLQFKLARGRMKTKVLCAKCHLFAAFHTGDLSAAVAVGTVKPTIQPPCKTIDEMLRIPRCESGEPCFAFVAFSIPICIGGIKDVWDAGHKNATLPRRETGRMSESIEKQSRFVADPVVIGILEDLNTSCLSLTDLALSCLAIGRFLARCKRIVAHFHHPHPALFIPVHINGVLDQWLAGDKLNLKARLHTHRGEGVPRRKGRRSGHFQKFGVGDFALLFTLADPHDSAIKRHRFASYHRQAVGISGLPLTQQLSPALKPL